MIKSLLVGAVALLAVQVPARAQTLSAADSADIVTVLLKEYRTSNGPVVRVVNTLACGKPESWGPARLAENMPCLSAAAETVIRAYAAHVGAETVPVTADIPVCIWNPEDVKPKGLRLDILAPAEVGGELRIGFVSRCMSGRGGFGGGFMEGAVYAVGRVNGVWHITRRVSGFIT